MAELSEAEQYLLDQVRQGEADAWSQLVGRYQGRLCAFARGKLRSAADAEDLVQETFLQLLKGLSSFRGEASLETYLFTILRRRIIDHARGRKPPGGDSDGVWDRLPGRELTASTYVARDEQAGIEQQALAQALGELVGGLKEGENLAELKVLEMLFAAQMRNKDVASAAGLTEERVALMKHRWIGKLREAVGKRLGGELEGSGGESLLTEIWHELRPTCPKRSTIGRYCLGNLDEKWQGYVGFHVEKIGCPFCLANLQDLRGEMEAGAKALGERVFQSTIGFFRPDQ